MTSVKRGNKIPPSVRKEDKERGHGQTQRMMIMMVMALC